MTVAPLTAKEESLIRVCLEKARRSTVFRRNLRSG
jgi:hypothetical protein